MQATFDLNTSLDRPWRRVPWLLAAASAIWIALLMGFAHLLEHPPPPMAPPVTLNADIVELPPAAGNPGAAAPAAKPRPKPVIRKTAPQPHVVHRAPPAEPELPGKAAALALPAPPAAGAAESGSTSPSSSEGEGSGGGLGAGSGSTGAHAIYAPTPVIPPDMRQDAFQSVAIARFVVAADGAVQVTLVQPTPNPRINEVLLETLKQWKFFPATVHGQPVMSQFDLKIPVSVQ
jgi:periplasmic protein TonB